MKLILPFLFLSSFALAKTPIFKGSARDFYKAAAEIGRYDRPESRANTQPVFTKENRCSTAVYEVYCVLTNTPNSWDENGVFKCLAGSFWHGNHGSSSGDAAKSMHALLSAMVEPGYNSVRFDPTIICEGPCDDAGATEDDYSCEVSTGPK